MRESKFVYNLKGLMRALMPNIFTQKILESKLTALLNRYEHKTEEIIQRVNCYNQLQDFFLIPKENKDLPQGTKLDDPSLPPYPSRLANMCSITPDLSQLKENTYKRGTAYYYDSYEFTRYFNQDLYWTFAFHDVHQLLSFPAICKSRPILPQNKTSILLKLDKYRHFYFLKDSIQFEDKKDILFFRGAVYQQHRIDFFKKHFDNTNCDLGHVGNKDYYPHWLKPKCSIKDHLQYKFILSLEGYDVASNLKWILSSNSLCIMPKPEIETWFMENTLQAGVHYAEINRDYSNLDSVLDFFRHNTKLAKEIIHNANKFCTQFYDKNFEDLLSLLVLRKYFYLSQQITITKREQELFQIS